MRYQWCWLTAPLHAPPTGRPAAGAPGQPSAQQAVAGPWQHSSCHLASCRSCEWRSMSTRQPKPPGAATCCLLPAGSWRSVGIPCMPDLLLAVVCMPCSPRPQLLGCCCCCCCCCCRSRAPSAASSQSWPSPPRARTTRPRRRSWVAAQQQTHAAGRWQQRRAQRPMLWGPVLPHLRMVCTPAPDRWIMCAGGGQRRGGRRHAKQSPGGRPAV
jgi:hypothetical protein